MKLEELLRHIIAVKLIDEIVLLVFKDHQEIATQAICNVVDKNPEIFNPIFEAMRNKKDASVQEKDNNPA